MNPRIYTCWLMNLYNKSVALIHFSAMWAVGMDCFHMQLSGHCLLKLQIGEKMIMMTTSQQKGSSSIRNKFVVCRTAHLRYYTISEETTPISFWQYNKVFVSLIFIIWKYAKWMNNGFNWHGDKWNVKVSTKLNLHNEILLNSVPLNWIYWALNYHLLCIVCCNKS